MGRWLQQRDLANGVLDLSAPPSHDFKFEIVLTEPNPMWKSHTDKFSPQQKSELTRRVEEKLRQRIIEKSPKKIRKVFEAQKQEFEEFKEAMAAKHDEIDAWGSKLYKEKFAALLSREENLTSLERQKGMWAQEKIGLTSQLNALQEMKKSLEVKLEEAQKGQTGVLAAVESFDESSISYTNLQPELDALKCEHDTLKIEYEYLKKNE